MYDIGENDAVFEQEAEKQRQRRQEKRMNSANRQARMQRISDLVKRIKKSVNKIKAKGSVNPGEMKFTGKMTDIAGIDGMKCSEVKNHMPNNEVYEATKQNIMSAQESGYINIDENNVIHLTDKGKELTQSESFLKQFEQDQLNAGMDQIQAEAPEQEMAYCEFNGTEQDMGVFNYTDQVDMNSIENSPNKQAVLDNFAELEEKGMVNIDENIITPTEKGQEFASTQDFRMKSASTDEIKNVFSGDIDADGLPDQIDNNLFAKESIPQGGQMSVGSEQAVNTINQSVGQSAGQASQIGGVGSSVASTATSSTVSATTGASSAATTVGTAATTTVGTTAATAGSTAATAGATAATVGTTVATGAAAVGAGAATAGVGAVVVVAVQALTQTKNILQQSHNNMNNQ